MKKFLCIIMCFTFLLCCFCVETDALEDKTVLYLDFGSVVIGEDSVTGYDEEGDSVSQTCSAGYIITQTDPSVVLDSGITVLSGSQNIELYNVNIARKNEYDAAFYVKDSANADIIISGENHLVSGMYRAGLEISVNASAVISGDGVLYAESFVEAGIGGGNGKSNGTLVINSGTIYASGGIDGYSAGIGGGTSGKGGNITINGGNIVAVGGLCAAGIGGGNLCSGGNITVNGGTVTAIGGKNGAGIGGGLTGNGGNIKINGGTVKAVAGENAEDIGNGYNCRTAFNGVLDSDGDCVSLVNTTVNDYSSIYINGIDSYPVVCGHQDDDKLYLYSDSEFKHLTVCENDDSVKYIRYNNNGTEEVFPFASEFERFENTLIFTGSIGTNDGYVLKNETELYYGEICIDRFDGTALRGDANRDGNLDGMDAVIISCVYNSMLDDALTERIADADENDIVNQYDRTALELLGVNNSD